MLDNFKKQRQRFFRATQSEICWGFWSFLPGGSPCVFQDPERDHLHSTYSLCREASSGHCKLYWIAFEAWLQTLRLQLFEKWRNWNFHLKSQKSNTNRKRRRIESSRRWHKGQQRGFGKASTATSSKPFREFPFTDVQLHVYNASSKVFPLD